MQNQTAQKVASESKKPIPMPLKILTVVMLILVGTKFYKEGQDQTIYHPMQEPTTQSPQWLNEVPSDIQKPQTVYTKSH